MFPSILFILTIILREATAESEWMAYPFLSNLAYRLAISVDERQAFQRFHILLTNRSTDRKTADMAKVKKKKISWRFKWN